MRHTIGIKMYLVLTFWIIVACALSACGHMSPYSKPTELAAIKDAPAWYVQAPTLCAAGHATTSAILWSDVQQATQMARTRLKQKLESMIQATLPTLPFARIRKSKRVDSQYLVLVCFDSAAFDGLKEPQIALNSRLRSMERARSVFDDMDRQLEKLTDGASQTEGSHTKDHTADPKSKAPQTESPTWFSAPPSLCAAGVAQRHPNAPYLAPQVAVKRSRMALIQQLGLADSFVIWGLTTKKITMDDHRSFALTCLDPASIQNAVEKAVQFSPAARAALKKRAKAAFDDLEKELEAYPDESGEKTSDRTEIIETGTGAAVTSVDGPSERVENKRGSTTPSNDKTIQVKTVVQPKKLKRTEKQLESKMVEALRRYHAKRQPSNSPNREPADDEVQLGQTAPTTIESVPTWFLAPPTLCGAVMGSHNTPRDVLAHQATEQLNERMAYSPLLGVSPIEVTNIEVKRFEQTPRARFMLICTTDFSRFRARYPIPAQIRFGEQSQMSLQQLFDANLPIFNMLKSLSKETREALMERAKREFEDLDKELEKY